MEIRRYNRVTRRHYRRIETNNEHIAHQAGKYKPELAMANPPMKRALRFSPSPALVGSCCNRTLTTPMYTINSLIAIVSPSSGGPQHGRLQRPGLNSRLARVGDCASQPVFILALCFVIVLWLNVGGQLIVFKRLVGRIGAVVIRHIGGSSQKWRVFGDLSSVMGIGAHRPYRRPPQVLVVTAWHCGELCFLS